MKLALKVVMQNDGDFLDRIVLYLVFYTVKIGQDLYFPLQC
jgi:hypothetical protein